MPQADDSFMLPKILFIKIMCVFLLGASIINLLMGGKFRIFLHPINLGILLFFGFNLLSRFSAHSVLLWKERVLYLTLLLIGILIFQSTFYKKRNELFKIAYIIVITANITAIWVLVQDFGTKFNPHASAVISRLPDWRGFLSAGMGNTNHIGDYLAFSFIIAIFLLIYSRSRKFRLLMVFSLCVMYAALIVCFSVSSNAGLIIGLFLMFLSIGFEYTRRKKFELRLFRRIVVMLFLFFFVTLFFVTNNRLNPHSPSIFSQAFNSERWKEGGNARLWIWANSLEIIRKYPWLGCGAGNFTYLYTDQQSAYLMDQEHLAVIGAYTNAAHNEVLQIWAEIGVFGLASMVMAIMFFLWYSLKIYFDKSKLNKIIAFASIICMLVFVLHSQMNFTLEIPAYTLLFFIFLSIPIVLGRAVDDRTMDLNLSGNYSDITIRTISMKVPEMITVQLMLPKMVKYISSAVVVIFSILLINIDAKHLISDVHYKEGKYYRNFGLHNKAEEYLKKGLDIYPNHIDCRSIYGAVLLKEGKYKEAVNEFEIVKKNLNAYEIYLQLGEAYFKLGNNEKAYENFNKLFSMRPIAVYQYPEIFKLMETLKQK